MQRRKFIRLFGGFAATFPLAARARIAARKARLGMLIPFPQDDTEGQKRVATVRRELERLGWAEGRNLEIVYRWATSDIQRAAVEMTQLQPDVILTIATPPAAALQQATGTLPIVFVMVADPVAAGLVSSLQKPGGNLTGFQNLDYGMSTKWLELLKEIAPHVARVGVVRDPTVSSNVAQYAAVQSVSRSFQVELTPLGGRDPDELERAVVEFARTPNSGLICAASPFTNNHRERIISLAARHRMPAVYPFRYFVAQGGLCSYGPDVLNFFRQAASYVDRILKGERPADLPVQTATKYELAVNLKTAKAIDIMVPTSLLTRADEVVE